MSIKDFYFGILNGGKSKRMGAPKSMFIYRGIPLIEYIYNIVKEINNNVVILGESEIPESMTKLKRLKDAPYPGPIAAVLSAYDYKKCDWFFIATDMYQTDIEMTNEILSLRKKSKYGVIPYREDIKKYEPFFAYYKSNLLKMIKETACDEVYSLQRILSILKIEGNVEFAKKYDLRLKSLNSIRDLSDFPK
ncbi:MAG TPA: molybdenum cofactor guanylyltransferase [Spirochaetota bacterium]|nr:molybdenum cofactor guanylyltransferase [Spirochaetota bacterium]